MTETQHPDARPQPYAGATPSRGSAIGTVALVIALVLVVIGLVQTIVNPLLPRIFMDMGNSISGIAAVFAVTAVVTGLIAVAGVITGIIGIQPSRTGGRLAAAAGLAISASHLLGVLVNFAASAIYSIAL